MKTLILPFAALLLLLVGGRGAETKAERAAAVAALEKTKFVPFVRDPNSDAVVTGYFLREVNDENTLGILAPTQDTDGDVHNYIVDILRNKIIGELTLPKPDDIQLPYVYQLHGDFGASWNRVNNGQKILCVIDYVGKWQEVSLRVLEISDNQKPDEDLAARYSIVHQADILPLVVEKLEAAIRGKVKKPKFVGVHDLNSLVDHEGRLLLDATGSDESKEGPTSFVVSIVGRYDLKARKLSVLDTSPVKTGRAANED